MPPTTASVSVNEAPPAVPVMKRGGAVALAVRDILHAPMPHKAGRPLARGVIRGVLLAFGGCIIRVRGLERVAPEHDPFILALNHSPYLFHTHDVGELNCPNRRVTMVLDLQAAYHRLRRSGGWLFRYLTADWSEALHRRLSGEQSAAPSQPRTRPFADAVLA